ncbi:SUKH-4 family immunity protein [Methylobacterium sp. E-065]|uniref:SUKH-4 family immunity protein n=1 Tax=Methylobacterium sp. E-065 TaxID=2836583 RepID=UPI00391D943B
MLASALARAGTCQCEPLGGGWHGGDDAIRFADAAAAEGGFHRPVRRRLRSSGLPAVPPPAQAQRGRDRSDRQDHDAGAEHHRPRP